MTANSAARISLIAASLTMAAAATSCKDEKPTPTVEKVTEQPFAYENRAVTLFGEVDDVYGERAFQLQSEEDPFEIWEEELLVISRSPIRMPGRSLEDDDHVVVSGKVRNLVVADLERELGWDLDPELETEFANKPIVIADGVSLVDEQASWREKQGEPVIVSYTLVTAHPSPESLAGSKASLASVTVRKVAGKALWVGFSHPNQLLVVPPEPGVLEGIQAGDQIAVEGQLKKMPPREEAIEKLGLDERIAGEIAEEPLYLEATKLKKVPGRRTGDAATQTGEGSG